MIGLIEVAHNLEYLKKNDQLFSVVSDELRHNSLANILLVGYLLRCFVNILKIHNTLWDLSDYRSGDLILCKCFILNGHKKSDVILNLLTTLLIDNRQKAGRLFAMQNW